MGGASLALGYPEEKAEVARRPSRGAAGHKAAGHKAPGPVWLQGILCNLCIFLLWQVREYVGGMPASQPGGAWALSLTPLDKAQASPRVVGRAYTRLV